MAGNNKMPTCPTLCSAFKSFSDLSYCLVRSFKFSLTEIQKNNTVKFQTLFSLSSQIKCKFSLFRSGIQKMLARIANREDPDQNTAQKQSDPGLHYLSRPFWQATNWFQMSCPLGYMFAYPMPG